MHANRPEMRRIEKLWPRHDANMETDVAFEQELKHGGCH